MSIDCGHQMGEIVTDIPWTMWAGFALVIGMIVTLAAVVWWEERRNGRG